MELLIIIVSIIQSIAISLGVGASTLAIVNFFIAIADGEISPDERKMMGVVYVILRIAMGTILTTTFILLLLNHMQNTAGYLTAFKAGQWTLIFALFLNAFLMTKHLVSSKFGPAIQAGTWYALGILTALLPFSLNTFTYWHFLLGYGLMLALTIVVVNLTMRHLLLKKP